MTACACGGARPGCDACAQVRAAAAGSYPTSGCVGVRPLTPAQAANTMAARLGGRAALLRQMFTRYGLRPWRVFLVWTRFSGLERGEGVETEVKRLEILPTPLVTSMDNVALREGNAGMVKIGDVQVSEIATCFTLNELSGTSYPVVGELEVPDTIAFFYEIVLDGRDGDPHPTRYKFRPMATPELVADEFMWRIKLTKISEDRTPLGGSTNIGGR